MPATMTKVTAAYHMTRPGSEEQCRDCTMFRKPDACTLVKGHISPDGVCKHFVDEPGD